MNAQENVEEGFPSHTESVTNQSQKMEVNTALENENVLCHAILRNVHQGHRISEPCNVRIRMGDV